MSQQNRKIVENIICKSSTIFERNQFPFIPIPSSNESLVQQRLDTWRKALDENGKPEQIEKYFRWQGIDMETAARMVSPVRLEKDAPLPGWAAVLTEVLDVIEEKDFWENRAPSLLAFAYNEDTLPNNSKPVSPAPFDELLTPFLDVIDRRLANPAGYDLLSRSARQTISHTILKELADTASNVLYREFDNFREKQPFGAIILLVAKSREEPPKTTYRQYIQRMQQGGLIAVFIKYPVLARLLSQLTSIWMKTQAEFLAHIEEDLEEIQQTFLDGQKCGKVTEITLSLSDRHNGGYSVIGLTFESGLKLVYKPKDIQIESNYNQLLQWLNEHGSPVEFYSLKTLVRPVYGWVAFVEYQACQNQEALERFYQRMGALLCLVYTLEGTDCHEENIIACGENPVLIDAETLFHHRVEEETTDDIRQSAAFKASLMLMNSVLRVGLLPGWRMGHDWKVVYDGSGLGGLGEQDTPSKRKRFVNVNTDAMKTLSEFRAKPADKNVPFLEDGSSFHFEGALDFYIGAIGVGFEKMYCFLTHKRSDLINPGGVLAAFRERQIRFVFRATQVYYNLSVQARQIRNLQDGADYSLYLERLARAHLQVEDKPVCFPLLNAERESLTNLDIPFFTASTSRADIEFWTDARKWVVKNYFISPSFALVRQRLEELSEEDLITQIQIIRSSMYARFAHQNENHLRQLSRPVHEENIRRQTPLESDKALSEALTIARQILSQKINGSDGSSSWFGIQLMPESGRFQFDPLGLSLYDGVAGVGLFFAAVEKILQLPEYRPDNYPTFREEALACAVPIRQAFKENGLQDFRTAPLGGATGSGSSIYVLLRMGKLLDEAALIEDALEAAHRITPDMIEKDAGLDIMSGGAGLILSLLALYDETKDMPVLERAVLSGKILLTKRISTPKGYRVWKTVSDVPLAGFSHGAAGFAQALLRLYQASREREFQDAADEAITYENTLFSMQEQNWRDLREPDGESYMTAWCHGAAGIGMQRASSLSILDTPQIRQDIDAAITAIQHNFASSTNSADHLCCGNLGRIEAIFTMGRQLNRPDLVQYAMQAASYIIGQAAQTGGFQYTSYLPRGMFATGFFQGGAGIGYELLRLTHPELLPNVLIWE